MSTKFLHGFGGAEHNIDVIGTMRVGIKNLEAGMLNKNMEDTTYGIVYNFQLSDSFYAGLGAGTVSDKPGLFTSIGYEFPLFKFFDLRLELNASSSHDNLSNGGFILGANINL
jgi:hypothetical protein